MLKATRKEWGRHRRLLQDPDVKRWYDNIARGSVVTADVRLRRLGVYCENTNTIPKEFAEIGIKNVRDAEDLLLDYVSFLEKEGYAPSYIEDILKALRSWLSFNYVKLVRKIKIKNADIPVTLENEEIPSKSKLGDVLNSAPARERVSISFMALAGIRPEVLGNYHGNDGLKISDIKDMELKDGDVFFERIPAKITVRSALSKAGHQYFTFLPETGCKYLQGYIRERIANGEIIKPESPVITFQKGYRTKTNGNTCHLRTNTITKEIKSAFGIIIKERPYVLRSYFDTQLLLAESKAKITHAYRQFFMGHKGDIEAKYTTNKHKLADSLIKDMREAYERSQNFLSPFEQEETSEKSKKELLLEMWKEQAQLYGIDPMKIRIEKQRTQQNQKTILKTSDSTDDEIAAIKTAIQKMIRKDKDQTEGKKTYEGKLVDNEEDLVTSVQNGWEVIKELNNGKVLLRRGISKDWIRMPHHSN
ncbi:MAG: site-specific integrase [Nitrosopumilaceae archaeon]|nr:site-specific integrase [Nitrosopumilaceae archaeon]